MSHDQYLRTDEFTRRMDALQKLVLAGQESIEEKLTDHHGRIAVLESADSSRHKKSAGWATLVAGCVTLIVEAVKTYASK